MFSLFICYKLAMVGKDYSSFTIAIIIEFIVEFNLLLAVIKTIGGVS